MSGERSLGSDINCSNQMEDKNQHSTSPEDVLILGRNASK
jgi:hypothetical protein